MKVRVFSGSDYHTAHERLASYKILSLLRSFTDNDEPVALFQNVRLDDIPWTDDGGNERIMRACEPDLVVIKRSAIIVVEMKNWQGRIAWPTRDIDKRNPWYDLTSGTPVVLCEGNRSPLSQLWYNRTAFVRHMENIARDLPTESAQTSRFASTTSCLLFTHPDISFESAKPDFWRATSLCTLEEHSVADQFALTVAAITTPRRDHRNDQRNLIELSEEDIEHIAARLNLQEVTHSINETTSAPDEKSTGSLALTDAVKADVLRKRIRSLPAIRQKQIESATSNPQVVNLPQPLRLLQFYRDLVEVEARKTTQLPLATAGQSSFLNLAGYNLQDLLSLDGIIVPAKNLPTWSASDELVLGVYVASDVKVGDLQGLPVFSTPIECVIADSVDNMPMRRLRVIDDKYLEVNVDWLKRLTPFSSMIEGECEQYVHDLGNLPSALDQISAFLKTTNNLDTLPALADLPRHTAEATFSAAVFKPTAVFTENLRKELASIDSLWRQQITKGNTPTDLAWHVLSKPSYSGSNFTWNPRKATILPMNYEQSLAAAMVYDDNVPLGVISGPPGTGKSQLICNVLAEAHIQNKTILFASNNNNAVEVVTHKLNKEIFKLPLVVGLGKAKNVKETSQELSSFSTQKTLTSSELEAIRRESTLKITEINARLRELYRDYQQYQDDYNEELELTVAIDDCISRCLQGFSIINCTSDELRLMKDALQTWERALDMHRQIMTYADSLFKRAKASFKGWVGARAVMSRKRFEEDADFYYQKLISDGIRSTAIRIIDPLVHSETREMDCAALIELVGLLLRRRVLSKSLVGKTESSFLMKWSVLEDQRIEPSKSQILGQVQHNVSVNGKGWARALDSSATLTQTQIAGIRTLSTTSLSVRRKVDLNTRFNIVIIDEASQSDVSAVIPLLYRAQRCIVIGDERQLQPIARGDDGTQILAMITSNVAAQELDPWTSPHASILTLMQHHLRGVSSNEVMLRDHHRCHPDIIGFSNVEFYEQRLRILTDLTNSSKQDGVWWINVEGAEINRHNRIEANKVVNTVERLLAHNIPHEEIGIVTPFSNQKKEIERLLRDANLQHGKNGSIKVDTAHAFQGSERDSMIYSLVVSKDTAVGRKKWASDSQEASHLINVAVTRARKMLIVVGDRDATLGYTRRLHDWISPRQPSKQDT